MKKLIQINATLGLLFLFFNLSIEKIIAQAPNKFTYQAIIYGTDNKPKKDANVSLKISILQGSTSGSEKYTETYNATTNGNGLVNLEIGSKDPANFSTIDWANGPYYIKIAIDGTEMGSAQLLSVPYALYAAKGIGEKGDKGDRGDKGDTGPQGPAGTDGDTKWKDTSGGIYYSEGNVGIATSTPNAKLDVNGTVKASNFFGNGSGLTNINATIPNNSISSENIVNGTIKGEDVASDAIDSSKIKNGTITKDDIVDEPAVKEVVKSSAYLPNSSWNLILEMNVTAPANGFMLVSASGTIQITNSTTTRWAVDINNSSGTTYSSSKSYSYGYISTAINSISGYGIPFYLQEIYPVTKGTSYNFYLTGYATVSTATSNNSILTPTMVALFIPSPL